MLTHWTECRKRVLTVLIVWAMLSLALLPFSNALYEALAAPLLHHLPIGHTLIATGLTTPFVVPIKLTCFVSFLLILPFFLYHVWQFIAPGLYRRERRYVWPLLCGSTLLFYIGMTFAYVVIFPLIFGFLTHTTPAHVTLMPDIDQYFDFVMQLFFALGAAFEIPIIMLICVLTGISTRSACIDARRYFIVAAFFIAMLFAPPDVLSQIVLAIPLCLLFEIGLLMIYLVVRHDNASTE